MIRISDLAVRRGDFELRVPSWSVEPGRVVGLVGPNGAGKTTLLRALAGLDEDASGQLEVLGHDPRREPAAVRQRLGFMSDDMPLFRLRVDKLLWTVSGYYPSWDAKLADALLERFELDGRKTTWSLSKGEGTRLRLVLAMAFHPAVLVLDEPATGLDVAGRRTLLQTVLEVVSDPARCVLVSSHQLVDLQRIADELLVLSAGEVVQQGPTDRLVGDSRTLEEALVAWGAA